MRKWIIFCLVAAVVPLTACSGNPPMTPEGPDLKATLKATPARSDKLLSWTYTLRNDEKAPIAVFNGTWGDNKPDDLPVVWVVGRSGGTVEVSERLFAPPENVGLARDYTQYGTILAPGAQLTGTADVSLPLRLSHPYDEAFDPPLSFPNDPDEVIFCLGIARAADVGPEPPVTAGAPPLYRHSQSTVDREHLVCALPLRLR